MDNGESALPSDTNDKKLQLLMGRWIESSDAVVLEKGNLGLDSVNVDYLDKHFARRTDVPRGLRIFAPLARSALWFLIEIRLWTMSQRGRTVSSATRN